MREVKKFFWCRGNATGFAGRGGYNGGKDFKFGFVGLWPKFGIRNSEFGIKERGGNSTLIISVNVVDRKGFFEDAEVRLRLSLSSPRNSEFRIPNSELDR